MKLEEAKVALAFFRGCSLSNMSKHVECELKDMEHQLQKAGQAHLGTLVVLRSRGLVRDCVESNNQMCFFFQFYTGARLKMMVASNGVRRAVIICLVAFVFTVASGFSVVNYHAKLLLVQARVTDAMDPNVGTILIGLCQLAGNLVSAFIIDRVGRKSLLYVSSAFLALAQAGLGTYFYLELNSPEAAEILADYRYQIFFSQYLR